MAWFKANHCLLQNRASVVLSEAFAGKMWDEPEALVDSLWSDPSARAIFDFVDAAAMAIPGTVRTARKGYTAWSRKVQFAALRPKKGGEIILGLAVAPQDGLEQAGREGWSERLTARTVLQNPVINEYLKALLAKAAERS